MKNFAELKDSVATILQRSADANYLNKIEVWLNFSQQFAYDAFDYYDVLEDIHEITTVNGTESYYLPESFGTPLRVYNKSNRSKLTILSEAEYTDSYLSAIQDNAVSPNPTIARFYGISPVEVDISTGVILKAKSSASSDTNGIIIRIEGYINEAMTILDYEEITISSVSPTTYASALSPKTFYKITHITKSADTDGYITIATSDDITAAIIPTTRRASRYPVMKLGITPDGAYDIRLLFKRRINKLIDDNDYPFIDADEFMIANAVGYGMAEEKESLERATTMWNKAKEALNLVLRQQQARLGPDYQYKLESSIMRAHRQ